MLEREEQPLEANTDQTQDVDRECLNDHVNWSIICMSGCIIKCLYGRLKKTTDPDPACLISTCY